MMMRIERERIGEYRIGEKGEIKEERRRNTLIYINDNRGKSKNSVEERKE